LTSNDIDKTSVKDTEREKEKEPHRNQSRNIFEVGRGSCCLFLCLLIRNSKDEIRYPCNQQKGTKTKIIMNLHKMRSKKRLQQSKIKDIQN
jgi:hypothetical protein